MRKRKPITEAATEKGGLEAVSIRVQPQFLQRPSATNPPSNREAIGIEMISYLTGPLIGNVRAGFSADSVGVPAAVWSGGIICVLGVVTTGFLLPRFWRYRGGAAATG